MDIGQTKSAVDGQSWEKDLPELGDLEVLVAPWENKAFERVLQKRVGALPPGLRMDGRVDPAAYYRCVGETMARTILLDWKNFEMDGEVKAFDKEYAETLLIDQRFRTLRDGIVAASKRVQQNLKAGEEEMLGKSGSTSAGSETGAAPPPK